MGLFKSILGLCLGLALAAGLSAQQIAYKVTGTFATPASAGPDPLGLAGNAFTANFTVLAQNLPANTAPFTTRTYAVVAGSATLTLTGTGFNNQTVTCGAAPAPNITLSNLSTGGTSFTLGNCGAPITFQGTQHLLNVTSGQFGWDLFEPAFQYAIPLQIPTPQTIAVGINGATAFFNYNLDGGAASQLAYQAGKGQITAPCQAAGSNVCPTVTIPKAIRLTDTNVHVEPLHTSGAQLDYEFIVKYPTSPTACTPGWLTVTPATGFGQTATATKPGSPINIQATNVSGTGSYCATVTVYTPNSSATFPSVINVTFATPPTITTSALPGGFVGVPYSATLAASGGTPPYKTWTLSAGALPPGLSLSSSTGAISGTPTTAGSYSPSFTVTDSGGLTSAPKSLPITVVSGPLITTTALPNAETGIAYSQTLSATGGVPPYGNWTVASGSLPAGLSLNASTGVISGTPNTPGKSSFGVTVTDNSGATSSPAALAITVVSGPAITTTSLPNGEISTPYSQTLAVSGGLAPFTWAITSGRLPSGLSLSPSSGVISGTPGTTGTSSFIVTVTDGAGITSAPATLSITVVFFPTITTTSLPSGEVGIPYSQTLTASGGVPPYSNWKVVANSGSLPAGLSLNASTGVLSGTPTIDGNSSFSITVGDSAGGTSLAKPLFIAIAAAPVITTTSLPAGSVGVLYAQTLAATGGQPPYSNWTVSAGALPAGLVLNPSTGVIRGTPTAVGSSSFSVTVNDSLGASSAPKALSIAITNGPIITTNSLPNGEVGLAYSQTLAAGGGTPPYSNWTVSSGALPAGLSLNSSSGVISGTPATLGTQTASFTVKDSTGAVSPAKSLTITIASGPAVTTSTLPTGEIGLAYSSALAASGGFPPYSKWTVSTGTLPPGLALDPSTGIISGSPSAAGSSTFSVTVSDSAGAVSPPKSLSITIAAALTITTTSLPNGSVGVTYSQTLAATGGVPPYSGWTVSTGKLPAGLSLSSSTGVISGKPTASGSSSFTVVVSDTAGGTSAPVSLSITIVSGPTITTSSLPNGQVGVAYSQTLTASGGVPPYSNWKVISGSLPAGLALNGSTGAITGTPSATGTSSFSVTVQDSAGATSPAKALSITIANLVITTSSLPNGDVNVAYSQTLAASGGTPPYSNWNISSGSLPAGLALNASTGVIGGTPGTAGTASFSVTVQDSSGATSPAKALTITIVTGPAITTTSLPNGMVGVAYSQTLAATGGVPPYSNWTVSSGSLPTGLSLNASNGVISGTPTAVATSSFSVTVADSAGGVASPKPLSITIATNLVITTNALPNGSVGVAYSQTLAASGGVPPYSNWTVSSGSLPSGLTLNASTGVISGTPASDGTFSFSVTVKDSVGSTSPAQPLSIVIASLPVVTTSSLAGGIVGAPYSQTLAASGGTAPYGSWTVTAGSLPPGLTLNASSGVISGTPTTATGSPFSFSVTVKDNAGLTSQPKSLSIIITLSGYIFSTLHTFTGGADGGTPFSTPILSNGSVIGTTQGGGANSAGTVYSVNASNGSLSVIHSFLGAPADGAGPIAGVVVSPNGNLYGATNVGGGLNNGAAYELTFAGALTLLHSFAGPPSEGTNPTGTPAFDASGNLFGTTYQGGANGAGTAYELTAGGVFSTLTNFTTTQGAPHGGLTYSGGLLYGDTVGSGKTGAAGTVFQGGRTSPLYTFSGGSDGSQPEGVLAADTQGNLYGTTAGGGSGTLGNGGGVIFKLNIASGVETILHTFTGADGSSPMAGLAQDSSGNWYGTTLLGGTFGRGTVYRLDTTGKLTTLYSFSGGADGGSLNAGVVLDSLGNIYGVTTSGGLGYGTVFVLTPVK